MPAEPDGSRSPGPFRALLFDFGGVLTTPVQLSLARFFAETGVDPARYRQVISGAYAALEAADVAPGGDDDVLDRWHGSGIVAELETGRLTVEAFDVQLAEALSVGLARPLLASGLSARMFAGMEIEPAMVRVARDARDLGYRTAVVSNTWGEPRAFREGLAGVFDELLFSHREGCRKPEPEIYRRAAARLGVEPKECVFVDDIAINVEGAAAAGMVAVLHRDPSVTVRRLEKLLGVRLGRP